jgi:hypothetical protein
MRYTYCNTGETLPIRELPDGDYFIFAGSSTIYQKFNLGYAKLETGVFCPFGTNEYIVGTLVIPVEIDVLQSNRNELVFVSRRK